MELKTCLSFLLHVFCLSSLLSYFYLKTINADFSEDLFNFFLNPKYYKMVFVSCFFPVTTGKLRHPISVYYQRAQLFFNSYFSITPLYIFTTNNGLAFLNNASSHNRKSNPNYKNIHFMTKYQDVYDIPKIAQYKQQYEDIAEIMMKTERYVVNAKLGAIWNAKMVFMQEIIEQYETNTDLVFWVDIGIVQSDDFFRKKKPFIWPINDRISRVFSAEDNPSNGLVQRMVFFADKKCISNPSNLDEINLPDFENFIGACFFGGPIDALKHFLAEYWRIHDILMARKQYVLREELVMAAYCVLNKDRVFFINRKGSKCNKWFSVVAFISAYNLCQFSNEVMYLGPTACTYPVRVKRWI